MLRLFLAVIFGFLFAGPAAAQCMRWQPVYIPVYPMEPWVFWGTPRPLPLPPAPVVPKIAAGVREEEPVRTKSAEKSKKGNKPKESESKDKGAQRIPKLRPPLPDDLDEPAKKSTPKKDTARNEPLANGGQAIEQFLIAANGRKTERPVEVKVGFFNHSNRDIVLEVNGEALELPREQYVTLRLKRTFTWAEKGQKVTDVAVPPDADGIEIVFRK